MEQKSGIKRFLLNRYIRYMVWALMLVPELYMFFKNGRDLIYQQAFPIIAILIPFMLSKGLGSEKHGYHRIKYRYLYWALSNIVCCSMMALLDFYFFGEDYLSEMITISLFYPVVCSPFIVARTYYTKELNLLDYIYRKYDEHFLTFVVSIVVGFYVVTFLVLWISVQLKFNYIFFPSNHNEAWMFILLTMIEAVLYTIIYYIYFCYKKKNQDYIYYR